MSETESRIKLFPPPTRPSRTRYVVLAYLGVLVFILYVDRICISKAAPAIMRDLELTEPQMGLVFSAFTLAYCLFEVTAGWWGDRHGSRGVLTRIVVWWSLFTALTAAAFGFWSLLAVRFLFGAGEAGALPNAARVVTRWFPAERRGAAQGFVNSTMLVGAASAPVVAAYLIDGFGWRGAFVLFALPGLVWAAAFYGWFRDNPAEHPSVNDAERRLIAGDVPAPAGVEHPPIPWRLVLTSANVWLLGGVVACTAFNTYLYFTWYPTYLEQARGVEPLTAGWLAGLALAGGAVGSMLGGFAIDFLIRRTGSRRWSRRLLGCGGLSTAALLLLTGKFTDDPTLAAVWTAGAVCAAYLTMASWWGAVSDISGRHLGALFGLMNSLGGVGAFISPPFLGWFVERMDELGYTGRARWDPALYVYAGVLLLGAFGWLWIDSTRPVEAKS